jgi:NAD-dependent SIR2 family protein deacetylase
MDDVDAFCSNKEKIDLIMVIGTSAKVYPAAGYVDMARMKGARVAIINMDANDVPAGGLYNGDWFFQGDAAQIVPELLKSVIGEIDMESMGDAAEGASSG